MGTDTGETRFDRRTLLKVAAAASPAVLAGCGTGGADPGGGGDKKLSLLMMGGDESLAKYIDGTLIPEFKDSTGYDVEVQRSDWGSAFQKVVTAAASGTLADILMVGGIWTAPLAAKNALLGLDDRLGEWADADQFYPSMLEDGSYEGKTYALPMYAATRTAMYRVDLLEQAGVSTDPLPATWEEYRAAAERVQAAGIEGLTHAVDWGQDNSIGLQQTYAQLFLQAGGSYYDEAGKAQFASPEGIQALTYLTSFYRNGLADVNTVDQGAGASPLVSGKSAMTFSGYPLQRNAQQNKPEVEQQLVAGPPLTGPSGSPVTCSWINKLGISAKAKDPDGAWSLVQHMLSKPVAEQLGKLYSALPARKDLTDAEYVQGISPGLLDAAEYIVPQPPHPNMLTIAPEINTFLQDAIRNPDEVERVLRDLDAKINEINGV